MNNFRFLFSLILWFACAANVGAEPPVFADDDGEQLLPQDAVQGLLDLEFSLEPVELSISAELAKAKQHYEAGAWQQAIQSATEFLENNPHHRETASALFIRGESHAQLQQFRETRNNFTALLKSTPSRIQRVRAEFRIAEAAMLSGQLLEAKKLFDDFRRQYPDDNLNAYSLVYLGEILARESASVAKPLFVESLQRYPGGPLSRRARLHLALIHFGEADFASAREELTQLVQTGLRTEPEYWTAWYWLAHTEWRQDQFGEATNRFEILAEEQPAHDLAPEALYYAAEASRQHGELPNAIRLFQRVQEAYPDSSSAALALVGEMQALKKQGNADQAIQRFRDLPRDVDADTKLQAAQIAAEILITQREFARAEALLQPYLQVSNAQETWGRDRHYTNLFLHALAQRGQGNFSAAREQLGRIRLDAVSPDFAQRVMLARIETWVASDDYTEALQVADMYEVRYPQGAYLPAVREQMIRCFLGLEQFEEATLALRKLEQAKDAGMHLTRAAEWVAENAYERGDYATARSTFELVQQSDAPADARERALTGLAWAAQNQGRHTEAAKYFAQFLEVFPEHADAWKIRLAYADSLAEMGRRDDALRVLEPFADLPDDHPERVRGRYKWAQLAAQDPEQASASAVVLEEILGRYREFEMRDSTLYLLGTLRSRAGQSSRAHPLFTEIVERYPESRYWSDSLYRLAEAAHGDRKNDVAKRYLTRLISTRSDANVMPHALFMQGRIESDEKNWPQARQILRELLRRYPENKLRDIARYGVAETFFQEKEFDRAYSLFEILNEEQRFASGDGWGAMVQLRRAQLAVQRKQLLQALEIANSIRETYPEFSLQHEVDYLMGRVLAARGEFTQAREAYYRVVSADPTYEREITAMAQWMIGETYFHQKRYVLAIKAYEALVADLQFANWQAASHLQIGKCYELMDNLGQAKASYSRVTTRFANTKWAEEAEYRLKQVTQAE